MGGWVEGGGGQKHSPLYWSVFTPDVGVDQLHSPHTYMDINNLTAKHIHPTESFHMLQNVKKSFFSRFPDFWEIYSAAFKTTSTSGSKDFSKSFKTE